MQSSSLKDLILGQLRDFFGTNDSESLKSLGYFLESLQEMINYPDRAFVNILSRDTMAKKISELSGGVVTLSNIGFELLECGCAYEFFVLLSKPEGVTLKIGGKNTDPVTKTLLTCS